MLGGRAGRAVAPLHQRVLLGHPGVVEASDGVGGRRPSLYGLALGHHGLLARAVGADGAVVDAHQVARPSGLGLARDDHGRSPWRRGGPLSGVAWSCIGWSFQSVPRPRPFQRCGGTYMYPIGAIRAQVKGEHGAAVLGIGPRMAVPALVDRALHRWASVDVRPRPGRTTGAAGAPWVAPSVGGAHRHGVGGEHARLCRASADEWQCSPRNVLHLLVQAHGLHPEVTQHGLGHQAQRMRMLCSARVAGLSPAPSLPWLGRRRPPRQRILLDARSATRNPRISAWLFQSRLLALAVAVGRALAQKAHSSAGPRRGGPPACPRPGAPQAPAAAPSCFLQTLTPDGAPEPRAPGAGRAAP